MDKYNEAWKGVQIFNQPGIVLEETGFYHVDFYGCWHKVVVVALTGFIDGPKTDKAIGDEFYMIGEYPEKHYFPIQLTP